jgi:hypothetical protein
MKLFSFVFFTSGEICFLLFSLSPTRMKRGGTCTRLGLALAVALIVAMVALWCGEASAQTSAAAEEEEALRAAEAELAGKSHYEVLGVATDATSDELKRAFHKLSRTLHPDKVRPGAGVAERAAAHARFLRTVEGSFTLRSPTPIPPALAMSADVFSSSSSWCVAPTKRSRR